MFGSRPRGFPVLGDYAHAERYERHVAPIRGRSPECKPLGDRRKTQATIRREGEDIVIRLYYTDIVRYTPDNKIIVNQGGYATQTTRQYLDAILPMVVGSHQGDTAVRTSGRFDWHLLHSNGENVFTRKDGNWILQNPLPHIVHKVDREAMKDVRKQYAAFINYLKNLKKLMGEDVRYPRGKFVSPYEQMQLARSDKTEDHYELLCSLVWRGEPMAQFNRLLLRWHRDEVLVEDEVADGSLRTDPYKYLF